MNKVEKLINELCPNGVEWKTLGEVTFWDKRFQKVNTSLQPKILKFNHVSAEKLKSLKTQNGNIKLLSTGNFDGFTTANIAGNDINLGEVITIPTGGAANLKYYNGQFVDSGNLLCSSSDIKLYDLKYIYYFLLSINDVIQSYFLGSGVKHPNMSEILKLQIPIPPIEIQKEIVRILDKFTLLESLLESELESRKKQYEYYRDSLLTFGNEVEWKTLGEIGEVRMCKRILKEQTSDTNDIPFYKIGTFGKKPDAYISRKLFDEYKFKYNYPKAGEVLISASGTIGRAVIFDGKDSYFQDSNIVWIENKENQVLNKYLFYFYKIAKWEIAEGGTIQRLYNDNLKKTRIPIPPLSEQQRIVDILDKFDTLTNSISEGLPKEIESRKKQYEYYRDRLLTFKKIV